MGLKKRVPSKFEKIISDIKSIKIQGANNIALAGIEAYLLNPTKNAKEKILSARPTEPLLQNFIKILSNSKDLFKTANQLRQYLKKSKEEIAKKGARLIKTDMNVFSHCHSSSVLDIIKYAHKKEKKRFVVYTLEVEPLMQGRMTAKELAREGIKVIVLPDLAAETAIQKCDLFLFGSDAFLKRYLVNKIGTSILCKIAKKHKIPSYSCGVALKFTKKVKLEKRSGKEVWDEREKNISVEYPVFDLVSYKDISGIISEFGILSTKKFKKYAKMLTTELV